MPGQESGDDNSRAKSFSNFCLMVDKPPGGTFARSVIFQELKGDGTIEECGA